MDRAEEERNSIYIGGLSFNTDEASLKEAFASFGKITSTKVVTERDTGQSRGFGFVSYSTAKEAERAINEMDGQDLDGRTLRVNQVRKQGPRFSRDGSFRDGRGGHGGGRGRSPPYRRGSPGGFGRGRRSPPYRGRSRSPRQDYSPHRGSPHWDRYDNHGSRSPYSSRSRSPVERPRRHEEPPNRRRDRNFDRTTPRVDDGKNEGKADVERLRLEIEEQEKHRLELESKVADLETSMEQSTAAELTLKVKNEGLMEKLALVQSTAMERTALLRKIQSAVSKVRDAEEQLKESEKELKVLLSVAAAQTDGMDVGGGDDHGANHEDEDGKADTKSKARKALGVSL